VTDFAEALKISAEFKKAVNDRYKLLEIDLDGVFQRLLLLQKKKYAAIKVIDGTSTSTEVKGLDMKRREYCALSKNVSQYVYLVVYYDPWLMTLSDTSWSRYYPEKQRKRS
jgi:DNA polymerase alpha subunit A